MSLLLREVTCCLFGPFERFTSNVFFQASLDSETVLSVVGLLQV